MFEKTDESPFSQLPQAMVEEMLSQTDGVKNRFFASFHERDIRYDIPKIADDERPTLQGHQHTRKHNEEDFNHSGHHYSEPEVTREHHTNARRESGSES